jgi:hypothetical protein
MRETQKIENQDVIQREMAGRERTGRRTGLDVLWARSTAFRMNPQEHGATRTIAQEKTPTQTSWGFGIGGGVLPEGKRTGNSDPRS